MKRILQQLNRPKQISRRPLVATGPLASESKVVSEVNGAGSVDNPKFYAMVLDFTQSSAHLLEDKLLAESGKVAQMVEKGRSGTIRKEQMKAAKRSDEQRKKTIHGIFEFMIPCNSILETNFRVKMDDGTTKVSLG